MKKKICFVVTVGSTIRAFFLEQIKALQADGHDVTVICSYDSQLENELKGQVNYIPLKIKRGVSLVNILLTGFRLTKIFRQGKFDLIQYSTPNAALIASIAAKTAKCPIRIYHLMGLRFQGSIGMVRAVLRYLDKLACRFSTHIECVSKSNLRDAVELELFPVEKASVIWNGSSGGVDLKKFDIAKKSGWRVEIRQQYSLADQFIFLFVGRITSDKGINELLTAFRKILTKFPDVRLLIVGSYEAKHKIQDDLLNWGKQCSSIIFCDQQEHVEKYYAASDVLVLPSHREGFGNVTIEAEAMGVPVIVSNISGSIDAMKNEETGLVFELKNSEMLYQAMKKMIETPELITEYSENAFYFVKTKFDSAVLMQIIVENKNNLLIKYS